MTTTTVPAGLTTGTWAVDASHSEAAFTVRHAGIAKVRGTVAITDGVITVGEDLAVSVRDRDARPRHGRHPRRQPRRPPASSADFFEVETYPTWTFTSTSSRRPATTYLVTRRPHHPRRDPPGRPRTEFNGAATDPFGTPRAGFSATTEISRKDFGLTWNAALETGGVPSATPSRSPSTSRPSLKPGLSGCGPPRPRPVPALSAGGRPCARCVEREDLQLGRQVHRPHVHAARAPAARAART